jgi:hypothetical protein
LSKYHFSQGKVRVEEGVYRPVLNTGKQATKSAVLILILPNPSERPVPGKEDRSAHNPKP